ncbi:hypothetical protein APR11_001122 [Nocardia amikacinitolerans]|nr:hypothetical protein [Nocardia amikacinitolerans]
MLMRKFAATTWLLVAVVATTAGTAAADAEVPGFTANVTGTAAPGRSEAIGSTANTADTAATGNTAALGSTANSTGTAAPGHSDALGFTGSTTSIAATGGHTDAVGFTASTTGGTAVLGIDTGALVIADDVLEIRADDGTVLAGTPLKFRVDEFEFPIAAEISGRTATLTPQLALDKASYRPVALPFEDKAPWKSEYEREQAAWSRMASTIGLGVSMGALLGGLGGAAVGCVLGGIVGATVAAATIAGLFGPFLPAAAVGCLGGVAAIGPLGAVAGQLFVTAPIAIAAVAQYFTTINAPFPAK